MIILTACVLGTSSRASAQLEPNFCADYLGAMGNTIAIGMTLHTDGHILNGTYFYKKDLKDIPIKGEYTSDRNVHLVEYDLSGNPRGAFSLRFVEHDSRGPAGLLTEEVLRGKWASSDGRQSYSVFLEMQDGWPAKDCSDRYKVAGAEDQAVVERNAQAFYFAVLKGDRKKVAAYIHFPFIFNYHSHRQELSNTEEFFRYYNSIFTENFVAKIAKGIPHNMFANWQGIMIGSGEVWFGPDGKAETVNN